jgi:transketolase
VLRKGADASLVATGAMVSRALAAADTLAEQGLNARVINVSTVKPLDEATIIVAARETGAIVTIEEAAIEGGLGASTGTAAFLFDHFGLNRDRIVAAALELKSR